MWILCRANSGDIRISGSFMLTATELNHQTNQGVSPSVAVIGGGLAGISAAMESQKQGARVTLFERSRFLGGRVASIEMGKNHCLIDNGFHLYLESCKTLKTFHQELNLEKYFRRTDTIPFAFPGQNWSFSASRWLPGRFQYLPAFLSMPVLPLTERIKFLAICHYLYYRKSLENSGENFLHWLTEQGVSEQAIQRFWTPYILSVFSETPDIVSVQAVRHVFRESLSNGRSGMSLWLPKRPLRYIYHDKISEELRQRNIDIRFLSRIFRMKRENNRITGLEDRNGNLLTFDRYILAVGPFDAWHLLEESELNDLSDKIDFPQYELGAITAVHLWFDRRLIEQCGVVLSDGPGQWMFCPQEQSGNYPTELTGRTEQDKPESLGRPYAFYHQILVSASHRLLDSDELASRSGNAFIERIVNQLGEKFPEARKARLLSHRISTVLDAVISPNVRSFMNRPSQKTSIENLALAGDWTGTGLPSTMEGAVRSGQAAVRALFGD